ncbi:unnamed protein product [Rotaria sp. Silwood1]|nr:unnamed protein product [Rotaria sp. Silwood1]CAF5005712.1 unnamed protein product [Rotaria sp. Silwood1]
MIRDRANIGSNNWHKCGLLELSHRMIFEVSERTLFDKMDPLSLEKSFLIWDNQLSTYFNTHLHAQDESELVERPITLILQIQNRQSHDLGASQTSIIWTSVGNTILATLWALLYLLRDPRALEKVTEETRTHLPSFSLSELSDTNIELWTYDALTKCIYLESAVNEMLRLMDTAR